MSLLTWKFSRVEKIKKMKLLYLLNTKNLPKLEYVILTVIFYAYGGLRFALCATIFSNFIIL